MSFARSTTGTFTVSVRSPRRTSSDDLLARTARVDVDPELPPVLHRLAVERQDDVARFEAGLLRRSARQSHRRE